MTFLCSTARLGGKVFGAFGDTKFDRPFLFVRELAQPGKYFCGPSATRYRVYQYKVDTRRVSVVRGLFHFILLRHVVWAVVWSHVIVRSCRRCGVKLTSEIENK